MTTAAWWHCYAGIAGDMAFASLVDAGANLDLVERELAGLPLGGWRIEEVPVQRSGIACTYLRVRVQETSVVRTYNHIVGLITEARLPERARERALATFARLAEVEGRLHRRPPSQVHFHEVGSLDAIVDIVGTCVALEVLGIDEVHVSPIAQGSGMVRTSHGTLPVPVPAVVELLEGAPTYGTSVPLELTTPTGAALASTLAKSWGPLPPMTVTASGFGAGTRDLEGMPNAVHVVVGTLTPAGEDAAQPIVVLEANVDDVTGEVLSQTVDALLAGGAYDAWVTPVVGKKGRPAHVVSTTVEPSDQARLRDLLQDHTGTLGVRAFELQRWTSARELVEVDVDGMVVRVKRSGRRLKAEFDDAVRVGKSLGLPPREVARRAEEAAARG